MAKNSVRWPATVRNDWLHKKILRFYAKSSVFNRDAHQKNAVKRAFKSARYSSAAAQKTNHLSRDAVNFLNHYAREQPHYLNEDASQSTENKKKLLPSSSSESPGGI